MGSVVCMKGFNLVIDEPVDGGEVVTVFDVGISLCF